MFSAVRRREHICGDRGKGSMFDTELVTVVYSGDGCNSRVNTVNVPHAGSTQPMSTRKFAYERGPGLFVLGCPHVARHNPAAYMQPNVRLATFVLVDCNAYMPHSKEIPINLSHLGTLTCPAYTWGSTECEPSPQ